MPAADPGAGGADAAPLRGPGWGVVGQQDQDLGVVGGGEAMKDTTTSPGTVVSEVPVLPPMV